MNVKVSDQQEKKSIKRTKWKFYSWKHNKNSLERYHSRLEMAERISELEESSIESIESEEEKKEWRKMNLRDQWTILSSPMYV